MQYKKKYIKTPPCFGRRQPGKQENDQKNSSPIISEEASALVVPLLETLANCSNFARHTRRQDRRQKLRSVSFSGPQPALGCRRLRLSIPASACSSCVRCVVDLNDLFWHPPCSGMPLFGACREALLLFSPCPTGFGRERSSFRP
ncbi:hypothetical protein KSP40_PGU016866 [Platanthera guangdongensis]|uniref:Uncharacterized protein n=1 Tax=Platanthera guangdongensis TaxID=2320717 RepID=A0ABR2MAP6_9ASPA